MSTSKKRVGLVLAMEEEVVPTPVEDAEIEESMDEIEEAEAETDDSVEEIEELEADIEDAAGDAETLEKLHDVMEESVESGEGMDETAAEIAEIAIEHIYARLGIKDKRVMPALESFGSSNSRVEATKIAMEGVMDGLKTVFEAIKTALQKTLAFIKDFFNKAMAFLGSTQKGYDLLKKQVAAFTEGEKSEEMIKNKSLASAFAIDGKADVATIRQVMKNHIEMTAAVNLAVTITSNAAKVLIGDLSSIDLTKLEPMATDFVNKVNEAEAPLIGTVSIEAKAKSQGIKGFVVDLFTKTAKSDVEELPVLSKKQMEDVLADVSNLLTVTKKFEENKSKIDEIISASIKGVDAAIKTLSKVASDEENAADVKSKTKEVQASLNSIKTVSTKFTTFVPNLNMKAAKAGMQYVNASLKAYK